MVMTLSVTVVSNDTPGPCMVRVVGKTVKVFAWKGTNHTNCNNHINH